ncbi:MAG: 2-oxoglutarate dehydrogenase E1 component [Opitutales bacterium]|nr:2-oxoglutarate dehydrogenase E1 component [Opitutales bacterium]MCH8541467.1 2-oxoglutarate dehydrogenase E1 component [Opitutales bacterium]
MNQISFAHRQNADLIDQYYESWKKDETSVDENWRAFFSGFELASQNGSAPTAVELPDGAPDTGSFPDSFAAKQSRVASLIYAYRTLGHLTADLDPLGFSPRTHPQLDLSNFGLTEADLQQEYDVGHYQDGGKMPLGEVIEKLKKTYCDKVGVEYIYIQDTEIRRWLQSRMEGISMTPQFTREEKIRVLKKVHEAEVFERFLHTRYSGQKRFSLEGGETTIAALDMLIEKCPAFGIEEIVMGMAHRGRLNVLANIMKKSYEFIFEEFSENYIPETVCGDGDVKYHLGYESILKTSSEKEVEVRLASNPSHLEAVNPVVEGKARARQRIREDLERKRVLPFLMHGDAAFAGQGVVSETLNFSQLPGYRTGGTIHFIINNQIGFTTKPSEGRSSRYCTDIAKMIEAPIFHVNGDDPLAVCMVMELALEFRQKFQKDIVIDMYCYRKHGHNETDEPMFTQPILYQRINKKRPISTILSEKLIEEGTLGEKESDSIAKEFRQTLDQAFEKVKAGQKESDKIEKKFRGADAVFQPPYSFKPLPTGVEEKVLRKITEALTSVPDDFKLNRKIKRQLEARRRSIEENEPIDWGFAEALAFGSLMLEGTPVRLSGQDSERGTFSHRHAAFYDIESSERYVPLLHLDDNQAKFCVYNSSLSEAGVLGFDFGYSLDYPQMLCLWEAQFGDFVNGAQVIIDQFLTSSESKWQQVSGMVLLLPHGYEGQGPEHSSARLERFLQSCAEDNIQVCNMTTAAQYFHCLRRQMKREYRKPLIIMSPKSLLRHKGVSSPLEDFTAGYFREILPDPEAPAKAKTKRLILCSGKVFYDLDDYRRKNNITDTTIIRVEQLYPLNRKELEKLAKDYQKVGDLVWCQEESKNMGAWSFIAPELAGIFGKPFRYTGRGASASPAVGALTLHNRELAEFLDDTFQKKS